MKWLVFSISSVLAVGLVTAPAKAEGTMTGATSHASATVVVGDASFDGPDCIEVPFDVSYAKTPTTAEDITLDVRLVARQPGSNEERTGSITASYFDPASGTERGDIYVCPGTFSPENGVVSVTGTLTTEYFVNDSEQTVSLEPTAQMNFIRNQTTMSKIRVKKGYSWDRDSRTLSGKATAATISRGQIGASGQIVLSTKLPGRKRWTNSSGSTYVDQFGNWSTVTPKLPKGTQVRATLTGCGWCTDATSTVRIR